MTRMAIDQPVRVFLTLSVIPRGKNHIASPPWSRARPLPRLEKPILSRTDRHSVHAGLQMALFHASGAHVLWVRCAPGRGKPPFSARPEL